MASKARSIFDKNASDVERLLKIHADVGGDAKGRRFGLEVLNKSAVVLIREAYCEDIAAEALEHLVVHVTAASQLPKELRKRIAEELKAAKHDLEIWRLADDGWKGIARARLVSLTEERNRRLNTPKADQIDELFAAALGLPSVSTKWHWKGMSAAKAKEKLDKYVTLRGAIAHRGKAAASVTKAQVGDYFGHVRKLVSRTGGEVSSHVKIATGKPLW